LFRKANFEKELFALFNPEAKKSKLAIFVYPEYFAVKSLWSLVVMVSSVARQGVSNVETKKGLTTILTIRLEV